MDRRFFPSRPARSITRSSTTTDRTPRLEEPDGGKESVKCWFELLERVWEAFWPVSEVSYSRVGHFYDDPSRLIDKWIDK